jgi:hypothetical protein
MARAFEGLGQPQRAVDIWSSLGRKRDVERVKKRLLEPKAAESQPPDAQPDLFDGK